MTQLRCKAGAMAWVTKARNTLTGEDIKSLLWSQVAVKWRVFPPHCVDPDGQCHTVRCDEPTWLVQFDGWHKLPARDERGNLAWAKARYGAIADVFLLPIRPERDPDEDHYSEKEPTETAAEQYARLLNVITE